MWFRGLFQTSVTFVFSNTNSLRRIFSFSVSRMSLMCSFWDFTNCRTKKEQKNPKVFLITWGAIIVHSSWGGGRRQCLGQSAGLINWRTDCRSRTLALCRKIQRKEYRATRLLTLVVYKVFVFGAVFGLLEVELPAFDVHFQDHLGGNAQRFLLDLRVKEETDWNFRFSCVPSLWRAGWIQRSTSNVTIGMRDFLWPHSSPMDSKMELLAWKETGKFILKKSISE